MRSLLLFFLTTVLPLNLHAQWEKLPLYGGHAEKLVQSKFNPNDIFAITAKSGIWYSSDGGDNWRAINGENNFLVGKMIQDLEVSADGVIWIIASTEAPRSLYKSSNKGINWIYVQTIKGTGLNVASRIEAALDGSLFLQVYDDSLGGNYSLLKSLDDGTSWRKTPLPKEADFRYTSFSIDQNNTANLSIYGSRGFFASTTDSGSTWIIINDFKRYKYVTGITYFQRRNLNVIGLWVFNYYENNGPHWFDYFESLDGGKMWERINSDSLLLEPNTSSEAPRVKYFNSNLLYSIISNYLYLSTDDGITWTKLTHDRMWDVVQVEKDLVGSFTLSGIRKSTDGGKKWIDVKSIESFSAFDAIEFGNADLNTFFVIVKDVEKFNSRYELRQTTDQGKTWKSLFGSPSLKNLRVSNFPEPRYYVVSTSNAIISGTLDQTVPDTILTWIPVQENFLFYSQYYDLEISDAQPGLIFVQAFTYEGRKLFSSSDAGKTWTSQFLPNVMYRYFNIHPSRIHPGSVVGIGALSRSIDIFGMGILLSTNYGMTWNTHENKDPANSSYSLSKDDLLFDSFQRLFSKDYGRTWFRNEEGILDSMKGSVFAVYTSGNHLIIALGQEWYQFVNDRWIPITDGKGNKLSKGLPTELDVVGSDFYGVFPHDGLYRLANTNITSVQRDMESAEDYALHQNYPNPFRSETIITYSLPQSEFGEVIIMNLLGQIIKRWSIDGNERQQSILRWDGTNSRNEKVPNGMYRCLLRSEKVKKAITILLLR